MIDRISTRIFIGDSNDGLRQPAVLNAHEITAVLNVAKDLTNPFLTHEQFMMGHVGLGDGSGNPKALLYASVLTLAGLLRAGNKVLVHCHEGRSRSPSVVAAYLIAVGEFTSMEEALDFLKGRRSTVAPCSGIIEDFKGLDWETLCAIIK